MTAVDVWLVDTSGVPPGDLLSLLDPAERQRCEQNGRKLSGGFTSVTRPQLGHFRRTGKR